MSFAHHVCKCPHAVFNGNRLVPAVQVVQVDHIGLQAAQAVFAGFLQGGRATVNHAHQLAVSRHIHTLHAAFAGQRELVAVRLHDLAHQGFVGAKAIQSCRVEQRHASVQRGEQDALALLAGNRCTIGMAQVHTAQADGTDIKGAELADGHGHVVGGSCRKKENQAWFKRSTAVPAGAVRCSTVTRWPGCCWVHGLLGWRQKTRGPGARCRSWTHPPG